MYRLQAQSLSLLVSRRRRPQRLVHADRIHRRDQPPALPHGDAPDLRPRLQVGAGPRVRRGAGPPRHRRGRLRRRLREPAGLDEALAAGHSEDVVTPFIAGTVVGGGVGDPTTLLARGAVLQAKLLATLGEGTSEEREVKAAFAFALGHALKNVKATTRTLALLFPKRARRARSAGSGCPSCCARRRCPRAARCGSTSRSARAHGSASRCGRRRRA
ncbi:hypothetical protein PsYK624_054890 [Phanerochaete sordida]|uniref:Uncharacterized protein n=1 Tax=Phanerochaete sordida TaxID=48140 RepID=A0A9P3G8L2_9APHY|nr:hypothetical protein PsYK624_054890 [Phanerochaete sordida]